MKLFNVHCGYYDREVGDGVYESHINLFIAAESFSEAKAKAKADPRFKAKKMHVDGIQELHTVGGYEVCLKKVESAREQVNHIPTASYDELKAGLTPTH